MLGALAHSIDGAAIAHAAAIAIAVDDVDDADGSAEGEDYQ